MNSYVLCTRDKVGGEDKFGGKSGSASYLEVPEGVNEPLPSHKVGGVRQWLDNIVQQAKQSNPAGAKELDIVFFVHGFNNSPGDALLRQRQIESELRNRNFPCMVIAFDWPTAGNALAYEYDRFEAQNAAGILVKGGIIPFTKYLINDCPINVHVMAHSMGGFVVREAVRAVDKGRDSDLSNDWRVGQLVLFAADLSSSSFAQNDTDTQHLFDHCGRLTNYFSGYDQALAVSNAKNIDISSRVGRVGMPSDNPGNDKAVDVDCGPRYSQEYGSRNTVGITNGILSHSWYFDDPVWYEDLAYTLKGQLDRNSIPTRKPTNQKNDFVLNIT